MPRLGTVLALLLLSVAFLTQRENAAPLSAATYTGLAQISGQLQLDLTLTPPVGSPGDQITLNIDLTNHNLAAASPAIAVQLPPSMQLQSDRLPRGSTLNLQDNRLSWLPVVNAQSAQSFSAQLRVATADLDQPEQVVQVTLNDGQEIRRTEARIWIGIPPRIQQVVAPTHAAIGQPIQLGVEVSGPPPNRQLWDLGDGRRVTVNEPEILYSVAGVYEVKVTVSNPAGEETRSVPITIVPHAAAQFSPDDDSPAIDQAIAFRNESGGQFPIRYTWDFGDGQQSSEANPQHQYARPGTYKVTLVAENSFGRSESTSLVDVGSPPTALISFAESLPAGQRAVGQGASEEPGTEYIWEMGDGRLYNGKEISHVFRRSGDYYVTMKASNEFGTTEVGQWVHVETGTLQVFLPMIGHLIGLQSGSSIDVDQATADLDLEPVEIDGPFVMEAIEIPPGSSPEQQLYLYVNEARRLFGLDPLAQMPNLSAAAAAHTVDMAGYKHTQHMGADGSFPAERLLWHGYTRGYAGEATAWGFADPRQAVEFWVNSPGHRPIILNPFASEVGVGYTVDYGAPSVWYWTAEFGNGFVSSDPPLMRIQSPVDSSLVLNSDTVSFSWNWPRSLAANESFVVELLGAGRTISLGTVRTPLLGSRFALSTSILEHTSLAGDFSWQVRLVDGAGNTLVSGPALTLAVEIDPTLPTATPIPSPTSLPTVTVEPTISPTSTNIPPTATVAPPQPTLPPIVTATPLPPAIGP